MTAAAEETWPFAVRPLTPNLGAEISGVALGADVETHVFRALYRAFLRYQVLVFPPQDLPPGRQVAFARHFGKVQVHV
ncbi:MAG: TauD/TfdA dioxygenase family protein, partial [Burkholderiales bacterium]